MLRTLPPRSAGGGPGHARLLAGLHDRPPPLRLQVQPQAPSPKSGVAAFADGALGYRTAFSGDLEVAKFLQGMGRTLLCACGPAQLAPTAVPSGTPLAAPVRCLRSCHERRTQGLYGLVIFCGRLMSSRHGA